MPNPPTPTELLYRSGHALRAARRLEEAISAYEQVVKQQPDFADAWLCLGIALQGAHRLDDAIAAYSRAATFPSRRSQALCNLGVVLCDTGRLEEAISVCHEAIALQPCLALAHNNLGNAMFAQGDVDAAIAAFRHALEIDPNFVTAHDQLLAAMQYSSDSDPQTNFEEHARWNSRHALPLAREILPHGNDRTSGRRLHIGYVSAELREHSITYFLENLLSLHDPQQVEVFCYADVMSSDAVTRRIQQAVHQWRDITGTADSDAAELIRRDQIDILVDLGGHMASNRLLVFARKPAPIQVAYLNYTDTTGLSAMDYRFTDALADPPGSERFHSEQLMRLPRTFLCYRPPADAPPVGPLPAAAAGHVTFGSFNNLSKMTPSLVQDWARILAQVPASRLVLKNRALADAGACRPMVGLFAASGIHPDRLELLSRKRSTREHLESYGRIDIALDTFPFNGATTTCEALWMGVPVITQAGKTPASRMGASVLTNAGLPHLIAADSQSYVRIAVDLAADLPRLAEFRTAQRQRMRDSPLMDAEQFARDVEAAYRQMWQKWCGAQESGSTPALLSPRET